MDRRQFLRLGVGAVAGASMPALWPWLALAQGKPTVREFHLRAHTTRVRLGQGPQFLAWTYNGHTPGPVIRAREGEIIRVVLKNDLPEPTSIHWHGVPVPNPMDGVPGLTQEAVPPGGQKIYEFPARPAGTFFYHSHVGYQEDQGLVGALIIEPTHPLGGHDREHTLVLQDWVLRDNGGPAATQRQDHSLHMMGTGPGSGWGPGMSPPPPPPPDTGQDMGGQNMEAAMGHDMGHGAGHGMGMMGTGPVPGGPPPLTEPVYEAYAVNGRLGKTIEPIRVRQGQKVRLRLINAAASTIFFLRLAGHRLTVTHADGSPVQDLTADVLRIGMGERYDVEFVADNPGRWWLAAWDSGLGEGGVRVPVLYEGVAPGLPTPPSFEGNLLLADYHLLRALEPDPVLAGPPDMTFLQTLGGGMNSPWWSINGRFFPDSERLLVKRGALARLAYVNETHMAHPMHLHGHSFALVNPTVDPAWWVKKDTVIVDARQRAEVVFLADNPGRWLHHCHNLYHMMAGMANEVAYE